MDIGNNHVQENLSKSKAAILGRVALTHIITKITKKDFTKSQKTCSKYKMILPIFSGKSNGAIYLPKGERYPPKNRTDKNNALENRKEYSAK